jgi:hypothetical protein
LKTSSQQILQGVLNDPKRDLLEIGILPHFQISHRLALHTVKFLWAALQVSAQSSPGALPSSEVLKNLAYLEQAY